MGTMGKRIVIGASLIALTCVAFYADWAVERAGWPRLPVGPAGQFRQARGAVLTALVTLLIAAGYLELARLASAGGTPIFRFTGLLAALLVGTLPFWRQVMAVGRHGGMVLPVVLALALLAFFIEQLGRHRTEGAIRHVGASLLAVVYLGVCPAVVLGIRIHFGLPAFILFLAVVKFTDIGAYFVGSLTGRHKLIPWLSPGKSWEGLAGGLALAAACGAGVSAGLRVLFGPAGTVPMGPWAGAAFGVAVGLAGQFADLCESALKRSAGLKDSGAALPAFGGVLDIIDSPLLAAPAAYLVLAVVCQG